MLIADVHQRNNMEIAVADVSMNGEDKLVVGHDLVEAREEIMKFLGSDDDVINERCGALALGMIREELEAFAADRPIFVFFFVVFGDMRLDRELFEVGLARVRFCEDLFFGVSGELRRQHELGYSAGDRHPKLRQEPPSKRDEIAGAQNFKHARQIFYGDVKCIVIVGLETLRVMFEYCCDDIAQDVEVVNKDHQERRMCFWFNKLDLRL